MFSFYLPFPSLSGMRILQHNYPLLLFRLLRSMFPPHTFFHLSPLSQFPVSECFRFVFHLGYVYLVTTAGSLGDRLMEDNESGHLNIQNEAFTRPGWKPLLVGLAFDDGANSQ